MFYVKINIGDNMNKDIDTDFSDINEDNKYKPYIISAILYVIVIILVLVLVFGLKNQKEVVNDNINTQNQIGG